MLVIFEVVFVIVDVFNVMVFVVFIDVLIIFEVAIFLVSAFAIVFDIVDFCRQFFVTYWPKI